ncbi:putative ABC transport system ATP-binding protein [Clostridium sp. CAG:632]|nr:putative ABC transport system ATP-binding protein [Clostridium sp. CAG:632]
MKEWEIRTEHLSKIYHLGDRQVHALQDVNLTVANGELISIVGTSGSGKSTLLHLLGALDTPTEGKVWIAGKDLSVQKDGELSVIRRDYVGFVFQKFHLMNELTVKENIILPVLLAGKTVEENYIEELMEILGLSDYQKHLPTELSGGQQQRVAIARALSNHPTIVLCDEPTGNLDHQTSHDVAELLLKVHEEYQKTILIVTHDEEIANIAERKIRIEDGKIMNGIE